MRLRRAGSVLLVSAALLVVPAAVAAADELPDALARQAEAVYSGEQSVVCATPDGTRSELYEVGQSDGLVAARSASGVVRSGLVGDADTWAMNGDYETFTTDRSRVLDRTVDVVEIRQGGIVRVVLSVDVQTGVVLASDVFNADGTRYCSTRFTRFIPGEPGLAALAEAPPNQAIVALEPTDKLEQTLPSQVGGFVRQSIAEAEEQIVSAFYVDGLFSFTLLNSPRPIEIPELKDAPSVKGESGEYRRSFDVGTVALAWQSKEGGYVLVGDLPLDLQASVLDELPAAESSSFFSRLWRGLFD